MFFFTLWEFKIVLLNSEICNYGKIMPNFVALNIDEKIITNNDIIGKNGTLIFFICNHCPYVKAVISKLVETSNILKNHGINSVAIMPNDATKYPEDSFEKMKKFSYDNSFCFPYLYDEKQSIAKSFNAVCTPDFFGFNKNKELQYRGRIGLTHKLKFVDEKNDLLDAMIKISATGKGPSKQYPSCGCSIKWK